MEKAGHKSGWGGHWGTHPGRVSELWPTVDRGPRAGQRAASMRTSGILSQS